MMNNFVRLLLTALVIATTLSSCRTHAPRVDYQALAKASIKMKMNIDLNDNHKLYIESASWIGTPYRAGGTSKKGADCSGLTSQLYKSVYRKQLPRSSREQKEASKTVAKRNLKEGDLVFFSTDRSRKKVSHVGVYLKNGKFIHASTSLGVIINSLDEPYYIANWIGGGRIN